MKEQRISIATSRDNTQIAYAQSGRGSPLVRAGTWLTHLQHDWDSPIQSHWFKFFSSHHTLVRYDPRGCGLSQREVAEVTLDKWVDDLEAVVDALSLERFPLLGMSQGAAVSALYALRHPERVTHLILYAPLVKGWRNGQSPIAQRWSAMEGLCAQGWGEQNLAFPTMFAQLFMPGAPPEFIREFARLQAKCLHKSMARKVMAALAEISVFKRLKDLQVPTTVIQISNDQVVPPDAARGIASSIPESEFVSIESDNHILLENEPGWNAFKKQYKRMVPLGVPEVASSVLNDRMAELSQREKEVLQYLKEGLSNKEIASRLFLSEKTIRNHVSNILSKFDLKSRSQVIAALQQVL